MSDKEVIILLVEDDKVDQLAMKRAFEKLKIANTLVIVEDGIGALEILRGANGRDMQRPYMIILDLNTPRMNGQEFLKELRADEKLKDSVVFVLTTSSDEKDVVESYNMNVAGYVVKGDMAGSLMKSIEMLEHYWRIVTLPE